MGFPPKLRGFNLVVVGDVTLRLGISNYVLKNWEPNAEMGMLLDMVVFFGFLVHAAGCKKHGMNVSFQHVRCWQLRR